MIAFFIFILGMIVGSFLNVLILRYNTGLFSKHRSVCFSCSHILGPTDLLPVLSFIFLGGKCRYCRSKISIQYPLVELLSGLVFLSTYLKLGTLSLDLVFYWFVWAVFIAIFIYDLKHKIIPNGLVYTLIVLSLVKILWTVYPDFSENLWSLLAGPIAATPFALLWLVSRGRWMGFGDVKLALAMGWFLGLFDVFSAITFAFWIGAVVGLLLVFLSKMKLSLWSGVFKNLTIKSEIPFAPFLIIGTGIVFFLKINLLTLFGL
jgi:leader peptidase (prepilin peptidase) / N-methyltransferase